tara:strand:+ start:49 stop:1206 length:1158 start_codon:yes stop_codon:yes gene_type:complete
MDVLDKFLHGISYKFPKGYPDIENEHDKKMLFKIVENTIEEQQQSLFSDEELESLEKASKEGIIKILQKAELSDSQLEKIKKVVSSIGITSPIEDYLEQKAKDSNIPQSQILKFLNLLEKEKIQKEFAEYIKNPSSLDLSQSNFTDSIKGIPKDKLLSLYRDMGSAIVSNVSIGPGEILFSILFDNTKKRDSKGDLDVSGKNVELKASTKGAGAVIAKGYNRGDWSTTKRKGRFEEFIKDLNMGKENEDDSLKILDARMRWPGKLSSIYDIYTKDKNFNKDKFTKGVEDILSRIYNKSDWYPKGKHFNLPSYFSDTDMDDISFIIDLSKELVEEYRIHEGFDGLLFADQNGNLSYLEGDDIINNIGKSISIGGPSDDVPRLKLKV